MTTTRPERDDKVSLEKFSHEWIHDQRKGDNPKYQYGSCSEWSIHFFAPIAKRDWPHRNIVTSGVRRPVGRIPVVAFPLPRT